MESLNPAKTAFITVHLQNDIVTDGGAFSPVFLEELGRNDTIAKANDLLAAARSSGGYVVFARVGFEPGYPELVDNEPLLRMGKEAGALVNGTWGTDINENVDVEEGDYVLTHTRTSPFAATPLDVVLRGRGIENVVVLGVATNASVEDAARWAANLGYRTIIASDASSAGTEAAHNATLESFVLFGEVATNDELKEALGV